MMKAIKTENPLQTFQWIKTLSSFGFTIPECASDIGISVSEVLNIRALGRKAEMEDAV